MSRKRALRTATVFGGALGAVLLVAGALAWWLLRPDSRDVTQAAVITPPGQLANHCRDGIGEPRVEQVTDGVFLAIGFDVANTIVVVTDAGNVVVDPGMSPARARVVRAAIGEHAPGKTAAIVYTHSHIDHIGGASAWADEGTEVWATAAFADHFIKQYSVYRDVEQARGMRQFGAHVGDESLPCSALGRRIDFEGVLETGVVMPTHTFSGRHELRIGGVAMELVEAHGETHDQLFIHLPDLGVLMPGDNYYRAFPNLYTIRGTTPRPVDAWIASLDAMRRRAATVLVPSHTVPVRGRDEVASALTRYRDGIQWVRDRVVAAANRGDDVDTIAESVGLPPHLANDAALAPLYGQIDWSARAIYGNQLGWFDGRAETLYPLARADRARRMIDAMGGPDAVWQNVGSADDPRWALSLLGLLDDAGIDTTAGARWALAKADALEALATGIGNSNGRGYLLESAHELRVGPFEPPVPRPPEALIDSIPIAAFFQIMETRLIPERSIDTHESVVFEFADTDERFVLTVRRGIAEVVAGEALPGTPAPIATIATTTGTWRRLAIGTASPLAAVAAGTLSIDGDRAAFYTFSERFRRGI